MNNAEGSGRGVMQSWVAIVLPLVVALVGLVELVPHLRAGVFGAPELVAMVIIGLCLGFAWGAAQARRKG